MDTLGKKTILMQQRQNFQTELSMMKTKIRVRRLKGKDTLFVKPRKTQQLLPSLMRRVEMVRALIQMQLLSWEEDCKNMK